MNIKTMSEPRTHIIIEDFFNEGITKEVFNEILTFEDKLKPGTIRIANDKDLKDVVNERIKMNSSIWYDAYYADDRNKSTFLINFSKVFWSNHMKGFFEDHKDPIYYSLLRTKKDNTKLAAYGDGDYYTQHTDSKIGAPELTLMTVVYMVCKEPKQFEGGEFVLWFRNEKAVIPFENNKLIIFASQTIHEVLPVKMTSNKFEDMRFTLQYWPKY